MSDEHEHKPAPTEPIAELRAELRQLRMDVSEIRKCTAVLARTLANHSSQFSKFAEGAHEELGQLHGGILLIDGTTQRIARAVGADPDGQAAGGAEEWPGRRRKPTPTDQHELPGGVVLEVPKRTQSRLTNAVKILKVVWYIGAGLVAVGGWVRYLIHRYSERGHH